MNLLQDQYIYLYDMPTMSPAVVSVSMLLKVFLIALLWRGSYSQLPRKDLYVTTEQDNTCPTGPHTCLTIADYLHGNQHLFASNTTLHFLPGQHIVNGSGTDSSTVVIANLTDFGVEGWDVPTGEPPVVTVQCSHPVNFRFTNITRLRIQSIQFAHCSPILPTFYVTKDIPWYVSSFYFDNVSGSLELENLCDLVLHNVHITESFGFGLVGLNLLGTTTVRYCHFYNNSGNASTNTPGGNALLSFKYTRKCKIEVSNSEFALGNNPNGSGGLEIIQHYDNESINDESTINIHISNCNFSRNVGYSGADMSLAYMFTVVIMDIENSSFQNSVSVTDGGSCFINSVEAKVHVHFSNLIFTGNMAVEEGGAIYVSSGVKLVKFTNCSFSGNRANDGGAVYSYTSMSASQCVFHNNTANVDGGHIWTNSFQLSLSNCLFESGSAEYNGGGVYYYIYQYYPYYYTNLTVINCTFVNNTANADGGHILTNSDQLSLSNCLFESGSAKGKGGGVYHDSIFHYTNLTVTVINCTFVNNTANANGGHIWTNSDQLSLSNCLFESGSAKGKGGGVYHNSLGRLGRCSNLVVINCAFIHNTAGIGGGLYTSLTICNEIIILKNCNFTENKAIYGGGMYMYIRDMYIWADSEYRINILFEWCHFVRNSAISGGGLAVVLYGDYGILVSSSVSIYSNNTQFIGNMAKYDSSALEVTGCDDKFDCPQQMFTVENGLFSNNVVHPLTYEASTVNVNSIKSFHLTSSQILSNKGSAIHARESEISLEGDVVIADNTAYVGGALHLDCYHSLVSNKNVKHNQRIVSLRTDSSVLIRNNIALHFGGGIALNEQCGPQTCDQTTPREVCPMPCFFNILKHNTTTVESLPVVHMEGNKALIAGNVFYGGPLETCTYSQSPQANSIQMFRSIFTSNQNLSTIDVVSDPIRVCFCIQRVTEGPYCLNTMNITVYRGQDFTVYGIAVAPLTDALSMFVMAELHNDSGQLGWLQKAQELNRSCDSLIYSVRTLEEYVELHLTLIKYPQSKASLIHINFLDCPFGFELTGEPPKCDCAKHLTSAVPQITCDINSYSVDLPDSAWIGNFSGGIVAHPNCPHDYCNASSRVVGVDNQDSQCSHKHSGVLCGSCQPGLSLALGSSHCLQCSNIYLLLLLLFTVAGMLLVVLLQKCHLTVSKGTVNGLIFYANIIQVNKTYFFPQNNRLWLTKFLTAFIAWINLDVGIETCFANGLNTIARVWLQFVFPVYVWIIVGAMIYTSRYSVTASKLTGSNAVPVLATLFLLSYTKLLRAVIAAVSPIAITDQNATSYLLWATDGNVAFLHGAHIPLFLMAVLMTAVYIVPLTTVVTLAPYLQARSQHVLLRWVVRIKPLLDAYTGPYTDKHRYWAGFMLLTRILLFTAFAANSTGDPKLNLLFINGVVAGVLVLQRYAGKLYKNSINRALEVLYLLNLLFLSAITLFLKGHHSAALAQEITVCMMVGVSFLLFIFTLCWHMYNYTAIPCRVRQKLARVFPKFTRQPPQPEVTVGGAGGSPVQRTPAQPTVSVIDMSQLREPLLTNN